MNDSFGRITSPAPTANNGSRGGQLVQIIKLPDALQNNAKAVRLDGQITQINKGGSVKIDTPQGEIEVRVKGNRQPQVGQRVEVEVPAGRPPRQATVRESAQRDAAPRTQNTAQNPVPTQTTNVQVSRPNQPAPQQAGQQTAQTSRNVPAQQPLPPALQEAVTTQTNANTARPIAQDAVVRLLSVPPAQANAIATEYTQQAPQATNNTLARVSLSANITAQNVTNQQPQILLQSLPAPATPAQNISLQPTVQNTAQSVLITNISQTVITPQTLLNSATPQPTAQQFSLLSNVSTAPTLPAAQTLTPSAANTLIPQNITAQTATPNITNPTQTLSTPQAGTLTPVTFDPTNPAALTASRVDKIDIQIVKITPPNALITPPVTPNATQALQTPVPAATQFTPPLISTNSAATLTAQVTGFTANNLPLVTVQFPNTPLPQSFVLQQSASNLQLGSQLQIIPKISSVPITPLPVLTTTGVTNPLLQGFQWPAINDLYNALQNLSPQAAASLSRALPNAGNPAQLAPAAMMFMAAVKSGDIAAWLGQNKTEMLERIGKADILSRLTQGGNTARAAAAEPASAGEWRAVPLPMFWEGEIHRITLYTRQDGGGQNQENEQGDQTRFVFDLSLSRMGDVQLDGLLRDQRLDLVVRAQNAFSANMQQVMRQAYSNALDNTAMTGDLNFQGTTKNWVHVLEEKEQLGVHV